jgi:hypothetical protein
MNSSVSVKDQELPPIPVRKESYTTWLYLGLAVASVVITALGFWLAGTAPSP